MCGFAELRFAASAFHSFGSNSAYLLVTPERMPGQRVAPRAAKSLLSDSGPITQHREWCQQSDKEHHVQNDVARPPGGE